MRHLIPFLAFAALGLSAAAAQADLGDQLVKLLPNDGAEEDFFGVSVAISGSTAIVGAYGDDDNGSLSGSAYLFDLTTGQQLYKLTADDAEPSDLFGLSVGISGDIAIVTALWDDDNGHHSGSAYLFNVTTGQQLHKLTAVDAIPEHGFGVSVAINSAIAIVGASADNDDCPKDPNCNSGSAYLFDVATGKQLSKLTASDTTRRDHFGWSVGISGTAVIVGALRDDDACPKDPNCDSGSAYVFDVSDPENPVQSHKLTADDAADGDGLGGSVAISGGIAIVGATSDDDACPKDPNCNSGSAYLFDAATGEQLYKLIASDAAARDIFGRSVAISDGVAIVSGHFNDDECPGDQDCNSGSVYLFNVATGRELLKLTANDAEPGDLFGVRVGISEGIGIVGAMRDDDTCPEDPDCDSGSAYVFAYVACPADLDADGLVGPLDLATVLGNWGPCPEPCEPGDPAATCAEDLDGNCDVGPFDLALLLGNWGPCP